jgi:hypothetical protein
MFNGWRRAMAEDAEIWPENVAVSQVRLARMTHLSMVRSLG